MGATGSVAPTLGRVVEDRKVLTPTGRKRVEVVAGDQHDPLAVTLPEVVRAANPALSRCSPTTPVLVLMTGPLATAARAKAGAVSIELTYPLHPGWLPSTAPASLCGRGRRRLTSTPRISTHQPSVSAQPQLPQKPGAMHIP